MKLKIYTEASDEIGYGHLTRCLALYSEAIKRDIEVKVIVEGAISNNSFLDEIPIELKDWKQSGYLLNNLNKEDYVIVDSYQANKSIYEIISNTAKLALYIDDNNRMKYPKGIIVNPSLTLSGLNYWLDSSNILLSGSNHTILRDSFAMNNRKLIESDVKEVLIIMGGTDILNLTPLIINCINKNNYNLHFNIVSKDSQFRMDNVTYYSGLSAVEMRDLMLKSDIAITAAGQTIHELIMTGTPFIAVQVAHNQLNNIQGIATEISSKIVLNAFANDFENELETIFNQILSIEFRKELFEKMKEKIDGDGPKRIIDALTNENEVFIREATLDDMEDVFNLSNDPVVRKHSINKNNILWNNHVDWYQKSLSNKETQFYIVTNNSFEFLGQVRFNIEVEKAIISISLSENTRGLKLASKIIIQSIKSFYYDFPETNKIIAFIEKDNIGSVKSFEKLGFKCINEEGKTRKYILEKGDIIVNRSF